MTPQQHDAIIEHAKAIIAVISDALIRRDKETFMEAIGMTRGTLDTLALIFGEEIARELDREITAISREARSRLG